MIWSLVVAAALGLRHARAAAWLPGVDHRYVDEKLIDAGPLGLPATGIVAAFADLNGDGLVDLVHLGSDQRTISSFTWDRHKYTWVERQGARIRTSSDLVVTNVVPGDFNYDGRVDLLVMGGSNPGGWWGSDDDIDMRVYFQLANGTFGDPHAVDSSALAQPMPLDATGTLRTDLLGYPAGSKTPQLWRNAWDQSNRSTVFELSDAPLNVSSSPTGSFTCRFPNPHFNAFIDLDGDCLADLFFMCQDDNDADDLTYQIWLNKKGAFEFAREGKLPKGTKSVGFADMDRDGTIDMVISSCTSPRHCALSIAYNSQIPLCDSSVPDHEACRDPETLCVADPHFSFDLSPPSSSSDSASASMTTIPLSALLPGHELVVRSTAYRGEYPIAPQVGDYNIDGYPDLLVVATKGHDRRAYILQSRPCESGSCTDAEVASKRRAFKVVSDGAEALTKITDVESVSWFDVDDDGSLDVLVQRLGNSGAARTPVFIKNNYFHDAFFLKAEMLNGACPGWCEPREPGEKRYRPFGASYSGASFKFTVLDPTGARRSTQYGQLAQSTYASLLTPYSYFGLGRTNNYVENLFLGSTRHQPQHWLNIEGLIPNSQLLVMPHQDDSAGGGGGGAPDEWTRMIFLRPGDWIPWVSVVLVGAIVALGAVVVVLHVREKREDEAERRARLLHLNFQAL